MAQRQRRTDLDFRALARETVVGQAFEQLRGVDSVRLRPIPPRGGAPHVALNCTFVGEKVLGQAGPYRGFFADVGAELQEPRSLTDSFPLQLFAPTPNNLNAVGENRDKFYPHPAATTPPVSFSSAFSADSNTLRLLAASGAV